MAAKGNGDHGTSALQPGALLENRYEIVKELGQGGMAVVYQANDRHMDRLVAVKVLSAQSLKDETVLRFKREAQALSALKHPNIVDVYSWGFLPDKRPFMVMEYLDAVALGDVIKEKGRLDAPDALAITQQVCEGLHSAHEKGVVHRDLKPGNIVLLNPEKKQAKIVDFGLARLEKASGQKLTQTGDIFGTPSYMSPEQCQGEEIDRRADIYSLGCVLYEMLCGEAPFKGKTLMETLMSHLETSTDQLVANKLIPADVKELLMKALHRKRDDRFTDCREFLHRLSNVDLKKKEWNPSGSGSGMDRRKKLLVALSVCLLFAIGALLNMQWQQDKHSLPAAPQKQLITVNKYSTDIAKDKERSEKERTYIERLREISSGTSSAPELRQAWMRLGVLYGDSANAVNAAVLRPASRTCIEKAFTYGGYRREHAGTVDGLELNALLGLAEAYKWDGRPDRALELDLYLYGHGGQRSLFVNEELANLYIQKGAFGTAKPFVEPAVSLARRSSNPGQLKSTLGRLMQSYRDEKNFGEAMKYAKELRPLLDYSQAADVLYGVVCNLLKADYLNSIGDSKGALAPVREAERLEKTHTHELAQAAILSKKGELTIRHGEVAAGISEMERGYRLYENYSFGKPHIGKSESLNVKLSIWNNMKDALDSRGLKDESAKVESKIAQLRKELVETYREYQRPADLSFIFGSTTGGSPPAEK